MMEMTPTSPTTPSYLGKLLSTVSRIATPLQLNLSLSRLRERCRAKEKEKEKEGRGGRERRRKETRCSFLWRYQTALKVSSPRGL